MSRPPSDPFGAALLDYLGGRTDATLLLHRDDGFTAPLPVGIFFLAPSDLPAPEKLALGRCSGRVLDCGAGAGRHALALQERGVAVTAIDVSPGAVEVMSRRGVSDAHLADAFTFEGGPYDTVLLLGHTIGIVGTLDRLDPFLGVLDRLVAPRGQVILDTADLYATDDPGNLAYHEANRKAGRYAGEIRMALEYGDVRGPTLGWLILDGETLADHAATSGWAAEVLAGGPGGVFYRMAR